MSNAIEYKSKMIKILEWSTHRKKAFDTSFIESVLDFVEQNDFISDKQMECIDNIITKFHLKF